MLTRKSFSAACLCVLLVVSTVLVCSANILQSCTPGFYKNHTQFIQGSSCGLSFDQNSTVSSLGIVAVDSCVGNLNLLQALSAPSSFCGSGQAGQLDNGEITLLRQGITRILNATNSNPAACNAINPLIAVMNNAINTSIANDDKTAMINQATTFGNLNNDSVCTVGD